MKTGGRGPVPRHSSERRRKNKDSRPEKVSVTGRVKVPVLPQSTHAIARKWYNSLKQSGQSQYFEPSDWAAALYVAEVMTRSLESEGNRAAQIAFPQVWSAMQDLLTTESARRRSRIEVERALQEEPEGDKVTAIDKYRALSES